MRFWTYALLACWAVVVAGCSATLVNHTATGDATASDWRFVDGDPTTFAATELLDSERSGDASEALVMLSEPRVVSKMVVHSPNLLSYEVFTRDPDTQEWVSTAYHQSYKASATMQTTVRLKGRPRTDAVLLRVLRITGDTTNRIKTLVLMSEVWPAPSFCTTHSECL